MVFKYSHKKGEKENEKDKVKNEKDKVKSLDGANNKLRQPLATTSRLC